MNANMTEFFTLLDQAGQIPSKIDAELGAARAEPQAQVIDKNLHVRSAHDWTAQIGLKLAALEAWGKKQPGASEQPPEVPPAVPGQLTAGQAQEVLPLAINQVASWLAMTDGRFSYAMAPSGAAPCYWYVGASAMTSPSQPGWIGPAAGATSWIPVKKGQWVSAFYGPGGGQGSIRADYYPPQ